MGVSWNKRQKRWIAQIMSNRVQYYLGVFTDEVEAAKAYDLKAKELYGEHAVTNF